MVLETNFQKIIMNLQQFWAERGCLIWQPYYTQVGAGTMNPATFLRVLGPEPWNVAYVEPCIRPDDGRYGDNPNRLQQHYQFQVILKPDPGNPQDLYLESLQSLGIDLPKHDLRFVEDNWETPALGAWGLGWEVWLDGQEITQFTYFQQAGGITLDPVSVEITYGLERIAMVLLEVDHFRGIQWSNDLTYGDVNLQSEREHSRYYFEHADVENLYEIYHIYSQEADNTLQAGLLLPAYDYLLKCSHTFNVLDTRGVVGVTERQAFFNKMREISHKIAKEFIAQRKEAGFPWLQTQDEQPIPRREIHPLDLGNIKTPLPFLLEIGTEELPVTDLDTAREQLNALVPITLKENRLTHGKIKVYVTPRRLVVYVEDLAPKQSDLEQTVKGPPASRAFDEQGQPTSASTGFARSKGVPVDQLEIQDIDGGRYAVAFVCEQGVPAHQVLPPVVNHLISQLRFGKTMRWNKSNVPFSRPIRWLLCLYGEHTIEFEFAGVTSDRVTQGLRFQELSEIPVKNPQEYFKILERQGIRLDPAERAASISDQIAALAKDAGGFIPDSGSLIDEVTNLVEAPIAILGNFDPKHLALPREVLISVMKKHQRYFPVSQNGSLLPYFITVCNGVKLSQSLVREGNEHVIQARFTDAAFFVANDLKTSLENDVSKLDSLRFHPALGSMLDKTRRITGLVKSIGPSLGLTDEELKIVLRAALLCKADLVTQMVIEMTSLQGVMGKHYALASGESAEVAEAIYEHYLPVSAGDSVPRSRPGFVLGIADRLDTLTGLFAVGVTPTGGKDPFGLRRSAIGLLQLLLSWKQEFNLVHGIEKAASAQPVEVTFENRSACLDFLTGRLRALLLEQGYRYDVIEAILAEQAHNPIRAAINVSALSGWVDRPDWTTILPAFARCVRMTRDPQEIFEVDAGLFLEPAEKEFYTAAHRFHKITEHSDDVEVLFSNFIFIIPVINRFFDEVLVMENDPAVKENRLGLVQLVARSAVGCADLSKLEGF